MTLRYGLTSLRMEQDETISSWNNRVRHQRDKMTAAGVKPAAEEVVYVFLLNLNRHFQDAGRILQLQAGSTSLTLDAVVTSLLNFEQSVRHDTSNDSEQSLNNDRAYTAG